MTLTKQTQVIELFHNLFDSGFHLAEIVDFLDRSQLLGNPLFVQQMKNGLREGKNFSQIMGDLGFADSVVTQLSLAERHGNVSLSLLKIKEYLENITAVRKKLVEVATYPLLLLGFLVAIILGLKHYLLPQMQKKTLITQIIQYLPEYFLGFVCIVALIAVVAFFLFKQKKRIVVFSFLSRIVFVGNLVQWYMTAYYAREWGNMLGQGMELSEIFELMQEEKSALFRELGNELEAHLHSGVHFPQAIRSYPFFKRELSLIIEYGEVKSKLGSELALYASKSWEQFFFRIHRAMNLIQPLIFVCVALVIVLLYAAMLLPIYENMEVHL